MSEPRLSPPDGPTLEEEQTKEELVRVLRESLRESIRFLFDDLNHDLPLLGRKEIAEIMKEEALLELIRIAGGKA